MSGMDGRLFDAFPAPPRFPVRWAELEEGAVGWLLTEMKRVSQDPRWHGEGSVAAHTRSVCEELAGCGDFQALPEMSRRALFLAALLHDAGKLRTTRWEDGAWTSPHHASVGSKMVRAYLWQTCGMGGTAEAMAFREAVCALIRHHMKPGRMLERDAPEAELLRMAAEGEQLPGFSLRLLCLLAWADARGRLAQDTEALAERVLFCRDMAEEAGCLDGPGRFADGFSRRAYFSGRRMAPEQRLYDDTWGEVVLLSGLPGTGKDTWIAANLPQWPVVSLDGLRRELGVSPTAPQGPVAQAARERARGYLREKRSFVWNATSLTPELRQRVVQLAEDYKARVRIVYLETGWETRRQRNRSRTAAVPEAAVERMLESTIPPMPWEAWRVEWRCV